MSSDGSLTAPLASALAKGWGERLDSRSGTNGHELFIQFRDEEAPRWISYLDLAQHRRALLTAKRHLLNV